MLNLDHHLCALHRSIRSHALLYRLALGTRVLLAAGFIPTGLVKLLGRRFFYIGPETDLGVFFETLYQSGPYWHFLGLSQLLAGILVLWPVTATVGAVLFFGIMLNIFVITLSYDFNYTPVVTALMLLATIYLLLWDYHRLRGLIGLSDLAESSVARVPQHRLSGGVERGAYVGGTVSGLALFLGTRGLFPAGIWSAWFFIGCVISLSIALWYGLVLPVRPVVRGRPVA